MSNDASLVILDEPAHINIKLVAIITAIAVLVLFGLLFTTFTPGYSYLPEQLASKSVNVATGLFDPETDAAGNKYVWTQGRSTITVDVAKFTSQRLTSRPAQLIFEIRSAFAAGGPDSPVSVLIDGQPSGQLRPDPHLLNFQLLALSFNPTPQMIATQKLQVELVSSIFQPKSDRRTLGTMLKSVGLEVGPLALGESWFYWSLLGVIFAGVLLIALANRYKLRVAGYGAVLVFGVGIILALLSISTNSNLALMSRLSYWFFILGSFYLVAYSGLMALVLPSGIAGQDNLYQGLYRWSNRERKLFTVIGIWLAIMVAGSVILYGRYNWQEASGQYTINSYLSSLYFFLFIVPTAYYLALVLTHKKNWAFGIGLSVFVIGCFPNQWLGLGRLRQSFTFSILLGPQPNSVEPRITWFPQALTDRSLPGERLFFLFLFLGFVALLFLLARGVNVNIDRWKLPEIKRTAKMIAPLAGIFLIILLQIVVHTGLRAPYTYTPHYELPPDQNYWVLIYLCDNNQCPVHSDTSAFISLDKYFNGLPEPVNTLFIRRGFTNFIASHFDYFLNSVYVYIVLNSLLWLGSVIAMYLYVLRVVKNRQVALYSGGLVCCGNGFIYFAALPMIYLANYAIIIFSLYLYEVLLAKENNRLGELVLFGVLFGFCTATYDIFPVYPMFILYSFFRGVKIWRTLLSLIIAFATYSGFLVLEYGVLKLKFNSVNSEFGTGSITNILKLVTNFEFGKLYSLTVGFLPSFVQSMGFAFFIIGFILALIGLFFVQQRQEKLLVAILLVPSILLYIYNYYGGLRFGPSLFAELPRLSYIAYPAIYIAAAFTLWQIHLSLGTTRLAKYARYVPWAIIGLIFIWHNIDIFGLPSLYFHFYWPFQADWLLKS